MSETGTHAAGWPAERDGMLAALTLLGIGRLDDTAVDAHGWSLTVHTGRCRVIVEGPEVDETGTWYHASVYGRRQDTSGQALHHTVAPDPAGVARALEALRPALRAGPGAVARQPEPSTERSNHVHDAE